MFIFFGDGWGGLEFTEIYYISAATCFGLNQYVLGLNG